MHGAVSDLPIALEHVHVRVGTENTTILDDVCLNLAPGAPTIVIGPNGSGKTTMLRVAMGMLAPSSGRVTWGGCERVAPLRRAIVFQRPAMLRRSAAANIRYALASVGIARSTWPQRVAELLTLVGLADLGERPARKLSGGEQQRLALARALARAPDVLFLDEPTAALDPASTKAIEDVLRAVAARNIKVVMSTHDLGEARRLADEIVFMHRGRVIEVSPGASFFSNPATEEARRFINGELLV